eukprot:gene7443-15223_t
MTDNNLLVDGDLANITEKLAQIDLNAVKASQAIYDDLVSSFPTSVGKASSKKEREDLKLNSSTLVYGEISFEAFGITFEKIKKIYGRPNVGSSGPNGFMQTRGGIFYDLGSGTGKPVVAAAILNNFDICYGIEILEGLHTISLEMHTEYNARGKPRLNRDIQTELSFLRGDILNMSVRDWRDGDVVFANSTCFDDALMADIAHTAVAMKRGAFFITFTKRLPSTEFAVLEYEMHQMSWGGATVYIHQKTTEAHTPAPKEK